MSNIEKASSLPTKQLMLKAMMLILKSQKSTGGYQSKMLVVGVPNHWGS